MWTASRLDEPAVSTVSAGPRSPSVWAIRPEARLAAEPLKPYIWPRAPASAASNA